MKEGQDEFDEVGLGKERDQRCKRRRIQRNICGVGQLGRWGVDAELTDLQRELVSLHARRLAACWSTRSSARA